MSWMCTIIVIMRLVYHPHIFSTMVTMAESIAKTNENVARKNANEEKKKLFFYACVESPIGVKQQGRIFGAAIQNV